MEAAAAEIWQNGSRQNEMAGGSRFQADPERRRENLYPPAGRTNAPRPR